MNRNTHSTRARIARYAHACATEGWLQDGEAGMRRHRIVEHREPSFWLILAVGGSIAALACLVLRGVA